MKFTMCLAANLWTDGQTTPARDNDFLLHKNGETALNMLLEEC